VITNPRRNHRPRPETRQNKKFTTQHRILPFKGKIDFIIRLFEVNALVDTAPERIWQLWLASAILLVLKTVQIRVKKERQLQI